MKRYLTHKARPSLIGLLMIFTLIIAACSSAGDANQPPSAIPETGVDAGQPESGGEAVLPETGGETVRVENNEELGPILVTAGGMTLYTNTVDSPEDLKCVNIACTGFWPPFVIEGQPTAGEEVQDSLGTVTRPDGSIQVTFDQQPLYTFYLDREPGDVRGEGFTDFGGTWHVISPDGSGGATSAESDG
jgi:predicted lipoprotein with Yx(FWY)xxD motif